MFANQTNLTNLTIIIRVFYILKHRPTYRTIAYTHANVQDYLSVRRLRVSSGLYT